MVHDSGQNKTRLAFTMLTKAYWRKLKKSDLKMDLFRCIPSFESDEAWNASKTAIFNKTGEKFDAGQHFELIKRIAKDLPKGECENTIDDADLSGMKENEIILHFVKPDQSLTLSSKESEKKKLVKSFQGITQLFGTDLPDQKRFTSELTYANMMERLEIEDEEGGGLES